MRAPALIALPLVSLLACTHISAEEHAARKAELSGADDSGDDTGQPPDLSGAWSGELHIELRVDDGEREEATDCDGELDATLTPSGESYAISGTGECDPGLLLLHDVGATLTGTLDRLLDAAGEITLSYNGEDRSSPYWTGGVSGTPSDTLTGTFDFDLTEVIDLAGHGEGTFSLQPSAAR